MIPKTLHKMDPFVCLSAMQKCIRRGMEREAMEFACELLHSSKAFCTMVVNRLQIISHEDVDCMAQPHLVTFVQTCSQQAREWYNADDQGKSRIAVGNAVRILCRAKKSREGDHFSGAIGLPSLLDDYVPDVPDWAYDYHTFVGRTKRRGIEHFRTESTKLVPPQKVPDEYEEEFYQWLQVLFEKTPKLRKILDERKQPLFD